MLLVIVVLLSQLVFNMPDGRAAKLSILYASRRILPYISAQALAAVYKDVLEHGVPEMRTRNNLMEAHKLIKYTLTPHGKLHQQLQIPKQKGQAYDLNVILPWLCCGTAIKPVMAGVTY